MTNNLQALWIKETSVTTAWAIAFDFLMQVPGGEAGPLSVCVDLTEPGCGEADLRLLSQYDAAYEACGLDLTVQTVASTIFPQALWNPQKGREDLYERYLKTSARRHRDRRNKRGVYFERMIRFSEEKPVNQIEHVITTFKRGNTRISALQIALFDPVRDHSHQTRMGFPCLQQASLNRLGKNKLGITAFYPNQFIFQRGYGNYLGLINLGRFMAHELDHELVRMVCVAGQAELGSPKNKLRELHDMIHGYLPAVSGQRILTSVPNLEVGANL